MQCLREPGAGGDDTEGSFCMNRRGFLASILVPLFSRAAWNLRGEGHSSPRAQLQGRRELRGQGEGNCQHFQLYQEFWPRIRKKGRARTAVLFAAIAAAPDSHRTLGAQAGRAAPPQGQQEGALEGHGTALRMEISQAGAG